MAKNRDYTCDRCGAQFDAKTGYSLKLCPKEAARALYQRGSAIDFDLCANCADAIADEIRSVVKPCAK